MVHSDEMVRSDRDHQAKTETEMDLVTPLRV